MNAADKNRQTGRTLRRLVFCLERVEAGENVLFVAGTREMLDYCLALIAKHAPSNWPSIQINRSSRWVTFPGGPGRLVLETADDCAIRRHMGARLDNIEIDHAAHLDAGALASLVSLWPGIRS